MDGRARPREHAGAAAPRARPDQRRRLPAAAGRAQPADPAIRPDARHRQARDLCRALARRSRSAPSDASRGDLLEAFGAALFCCTLLPLLVLQAQARPAAEGSSARSFPTRSTSSCAACAPAIRCRSRSRMVAREMTDPIGTEFGIVADEITYGADLETAHAQSLFPRRPGRPAAVRHRGGDPELDRRQSRRNPGKPLRA